MTEVTLDGISAWVGFLDELIQSCRSLTDLSLIDVLIIGDAIADHESIIYLLKRLKERQARKGFCKLCTTFTKVCIERQEGGMTASNEAITAILQENRKTWRASLEAAYQPMARRRRPGWRHSESDDDSGSSYDDSEFDDDSVSTHDDSELDDESDLDVDSELDYDSQLNDGSDAI